MTTLFQKELKGKENKEHLNENGPNSRFLLADSLEPWNHFNGKKSRYKCQDLAGCLSGVLVSR